MPRYRHTAVERNRVKRRLREIVRVDLLPAVRGLELVIRARPEAYDASHAQLRDDIVAAQRRIGRLLAETRTEGR